MILEEALEAHAAGINVLLPAEDGTKRPALGSWKRFQTERVSEDQIQAWCCNGATGLGVVGGAVSGNLELFEFDEYAVYEEFMVTAPQVGLGELVERIQSGYAEMTPGDGVHWFYRCVDGVDTNTKLARRPKLSEEMEHPNDTVKVLIETRGEGGFAVTAPSHGKVHPTGNPYVRFHGGFATIAEITGDERRALHEFAAAFDRMPKAEPRDPKVSTITAWKMRPGDDFAARTSWAQQLEPRGWEKLFTTAAGIEHWRRPGKKLGTSATISDEGSGVLYVFSSSTPLEPDRGYSKFTAYVVLEHHGDADAAVKELIAKGYGVPADEQRHEPSAAASLRYVKIKTSLLTVEGLAALPPPEPLVDGVLSRNTVAVAYGRPGVSKSFVSIDISLSVASGSWWFEHAVHPGPVIYVAAEGTGGLGLRQDAWMEARRVHEIPNMFWLPRPVRLLDPHDVDAFRFVVEELQPVLVIFDTLSRCMAGGDENQPKDMTLAVDALDRVRQVNGATVFAVHHSPKDGGTPRGHSALEGAADAIIEISCTDDVVKLTSKKAKDSVPFPAIRLQRVPVGESCVLTDRLSSSEDLSAGAIDLLRVLDEIADAAGVASSTWQKAAEGVAVRSFFRWQKMLVERSFTANVGTEARKRYTVTEQGKQALKR